MKAVHRLKENRDFRRAFQRGKSSATARLVLYWSDTRNETYRVGFSVSKKVGNAVVRNRLKRLLRECFLRYEEQLRGVRADFVVICRAPAATATFDDLDKDLRRLLQKGHFMVS